MKKLLTVTLMAFMFVGCSKKYYSNQHALFRSWECVADLDSTFKLNIYLDGMKHGVRGIFEETIEFDGNPKELLLIDATVLIDSGYFTENDRLASASGRVLVHDPAFPDTKNFILRNNVLKVVDAIKDENGDVVSGVTCLSM